MTGRALASRHALSHPTRRADAPSQRVGEGPSLLELSQSFSGSAVLKVVAKVESELGGRSPEAGGIRGIIAGVVEY